VRTVACGGGGTAAAPDDGLASVTGVKIRVGGLGGLASTMTIEEVGMAPAGPTVGGDETVGVPPQSWADGGRRWWDGVGTGEEEAYDSQGARRALGEEHDEHRRLKDGE
jgi:hypothetical protein